MLLVLDQAGYLDIYASLADAEKQLETTDIENGEYEFCDQTGQRFEGQITAPITSFRSGSFRLIPKQEPDPALPLSFVARARKLGRSLKHIRNLEALKVALTKSP